MEKLNEANKRLPADVRHKACPVPGSTKPGYSAIYRNASLDRDELYEAPCPELNTLAKLFAAACDAFADSDCMGVRRFNNVEKMKFDGFYTYETYTTVRERKNKLAAGIVYLVTNHSKHKKTATYENGKPKFTVSLLSPNRYEWVLTDMACRDYSLPNTALYPTLGPSSSRYILELTESPILFLAKDQLPKIIKLKSEGYLPDLNILVSFDDFNHDDSPLFAKAKAAGVDLLDFRAVEKTGERNPLPDGEAFNPPTPDTIYTYSFTSGTTGNPKGVVLTHRIAVCGVFSCNMTIDRPISKINMKKYMDFTQNTDDKGHQLTTICSLPLAHIYERQNTLQAMTVGMRVAMLSQPTDPRAMFGDIVACEPHYWCSVPRVWNKLEGAIRAYLKGKYNLSGSIKAAKVHEVDKLLIRNDVRHRFGLENAKMLFTGSAPLGKETITFLKDVLCVGFGVGYGSTESFAGVCFGEAFEDVVSNSSGPPAITCEIRLRDLTSMGYSVNDKPFARGELMLRGPQIFKEYFKNEKATKESFDEDGFFYTGDVAAMDENGGLYIIDRVKNFFKLAQGEYVTPEKIENVYLAHSPLLTQIFVHGDSLKNYLVGVAGIDPVIVSKMLKKYYDVDIKGEDLFNLLRDPKFKKMVLREINKHVAKADLQGFEKLHNVHFDLEPLRIEDEVLTPTLKLKRDNARKKFKSVLEKLYDEGSLVKDNKL